MKSSLVNLNDNFRQFIGTEHYHIHFSRICIFTEGVKSLAEEYQAYWLIDVIASYQITERIKSIPFQIWTILSADGKGVIEMRQDADQPVLVRQKIPFTDFPEGYLQLYCIDDGTYRVLMLPSEY
jgi:hypothetical protein